MKSYIIAVKDHIRCPVNVFLQISNNFHLNGLNTDNEIDSKDQIKAFTQKLVSFSFFFFSVGKNMFVYNLELKIKSTNLRSLFLWNLIWNHGYSKSYFVKLDFSKLQYSMLLYVQ